MVNKIKEKPSFYVFYIIGLFFALLAIIFPVYGIPLFVIGVISFVVALSETVAWGVEKEKRALKVKKVKRKK